MTTRAKFKCRAINPSADGFEIDLYAVTGGSAENEEFFKYTPAGSIKLGIVSADIATQFEPGQSYFVDFTNAE
ncbi:MAG: hypothetical protein JWM78_1681 [Verrucomicrobiaceae bacterium]|nr:hypothetical protein [Verrucomicrobiaceae bacterium]